VATLTSGISSRHFFSRPARDRFDKRRLILIELAVLIVALLVDGSGATLPAAGRGEPDRRITSGFAQLVIPLTAELAPPERRGRVMGTRSPACFSESSRRLAGDSSPSSSAGAGPTWGPR